MKNINNLIIFCRPNEDNGQFHIFADVSGITRYLFSQKFNPVLYEILKPGITLGELRRLRHTNYNLKRSVYIERTDYAVRRIIKAAERSAAVPAA